MEDKRSRIERRGLNVGRDGGGLTVTVPNISVEKLDEPSCFFTVARVAAYVIFSRTYIEQSLQTIRVTGEGMEVSGGEKMQ